MAATFILQKFFGEMYSPLDWQGLRQNERLKKCIRKVMAIGYLPLLLVRQNFNIHRNANSTRRLERRFSALNDFFNYVQRNYLDGNFSHVECVREGHGQ